MKRDPKQFKGLMEVSSVGLAMGISMLLGLWVGRSLDNFFNTSPWLTVLFLFFGIAGGFRNMYVAMKRQMKASELEDAADNVSVDKTEKNNNDDD